MFETCWNCWSITRKCSVLVVAPRSQRWQLMLPNGLGLEGTLKAVAPECLRLKAHCQSCKAQALHLKKTKPRGWDLFHQAFPEGKRDDLTVLASTSTGMAHEKKWGWLKQDIGCGWFETPFGGAPFKVIATSEFKFQKSVFGKIMAYGNKWKIEQTTLHWHHSRTSEHLSNPSCGFRAKLVRLISDLSVLNKGRGSTSIPKASATTRISENKIAASTPYLRKGCMVTSLALGDAWVNLLFNLKKVWSMSNPILLWQSRIALPHPSDLAEVVKSSFCLGHAKFKHTQNLHLLSSQSITLAIEVQNAVWWRRADVLDTGPAEMSKDAPPAFITSWESLRCLNRFWLAAFSLLVRGMCSRHVVVSSRIVL